MKIEDKRQVEKMRISEMIPGCVFAWNEYGEGGEYYIVTDINADKRHATCVNLKYGTNALFTKEKTVELVDATVVIK